MALDVHLRGFDLANKKGSGGDLLVGAAMTISAGRRYGLLGRNGCGKTTLLQYLASRPDAPREKKPAIPARMSLLLVKQEVVGSELCAVEIVVRSDTRREGLKAAIASLEAVAKPTPSALDALAKCYEKLARRDELRGAPGPRARQVLSGLGFTQEMMDRQTSELSGGWRMRCSIAAALFAAPSMLLLDEPTNHLDLEAARSRVMWLEKYLTTKYHGTLVMVSHDRAFLNAVVTDVVHLDHKKLKTYRGDVKSFEVVRLDDLARQAKARQVQEAKRDHMQKYIDDHSKAGENGPKAAAQRKSRMKKMSRLGLSYDGAAEETEEIEEDDPVELYFPDPGPFENRSIVKMQRASFSYKDQLAPMLLKDCDMSIDSNARIALLGRNGCGKSTLIKLLVGDLFPNRGGDVFIEPGAKIEYVAQHQLEQLDPFGTPLEALQERYPGDGSTSHEQVLRNHLAHFGLGGDTLPSQKIHTLSGGQKCRVCLAAAMYRRPHLLVLDEPTNHLDMETTDALILAIKNFKGGVLLVSHDEHLCSNVCSQLYVVQDAKLERLSGSFAQYKKDVLAGRR
ncbi:P-loop containing nucleoside triphosphate hydrolase protein [Pelagophyceae sp. CCMP2097]|nr:P-loop containing nucleoside triphosphate hydrolase protein [Pelagophyceae sp. CCMP2097]